MDTTATATEPTTTTDLAVPDSPLIEQKPRRRNLAGLPIEALGRVWTLPHLGLAPGFEAERNRLYDDLMLGGQVNSLDVNHCAIAMLLVNYDMSPLAALQVVLAADRASLVDVVVSNVLPLDVPHERENLSGWVRSALLANGLDPAKVPAEDLAGVLRHLVQTSRACSHDVYTAAGRFQSERNELIDMM